MATASDISVKHPQHKGSFLQLLKAYFSSSRIGEILILEGKLAGTGLQDALLIAQQENRRIGDVLVSHGFIRPHDLYGALAKQLGIRFLAWTVALFVTIGSFSPRTARSDDRSPMIAHTQLFDMARYTPHGASRSYPSLFGSAERKSSDLSAFTKWTSMFERYATEMSSESARATLVNWTKSVQTENGTPSLAKMARYVDSAFNEIAYVEDRVNYGKSDYWATPIEFLKNGGDCEDFAIAKYVALKSMGISDDYLRIAIVHDTVKNIPHAILIVYTEEGPMILDNQSRTTRMAREITRYKPIFSINQHAWWLHTRGENVQIATAAN